MNSKDFFFPTSKVEVNDEHLFSLIFLSPDLAFPLKKKDCDGALPALPPSFCHYAISKTRPSFTFESKWATQVQEYLKKIDI